jgi:hypothetical protein
MALRVKEKMVPAQRMAGVFPRHGTGGGRAPRGVQETVTVGAFGRRSGGRRNVRLGSGRHAPRAGFTGTDSFVMVSRGEWQGRPVTGQVTFAVTVLPRP